MNVSGGGSIKISITNRLRMVADMVNKNTILCDVGCDHGYLPIYLLQEKKVAFVYACDINEGPLLSAQANFKKFSLLEKAEFIRTDGLKGIKKADVVTICGMGGKLIGRILTEGKDLLKEVSQLLLQPMTEAVYLRKFLYENGFYIKREEIAKEDRRFYTIMDVGIGNQKPLCLLDMYTGFSFINKNNASFLDYFHNQHTKFTKMVYLKNGYEDVAEYRMVTDKIAEIIKDTH